MAQSAEKGGMWEKRAGWLATLLGLLTVMLVFRSIELAEVFR
jgi:hypothetical protein